MNTLTDTQIALMMKAALEYNAAIIAHASMIYGKELSEEQRKQSGADFLNTQRVYAKKIDEIVEL
jgi:hypothetical protein